MLGAIIAGLLATRVPGVQGSAELLRGGESIASAPFYPLPTARSVLAIQSGSQPYRHGGTAWLAFPGNLDPHAIEHRFFAIAIPAGCDALARTARHFPLFPTGPPAHS